MKAIDIPAQVGVDVQMDKHNVTILREAKYGIGHQQGFDTEFPSVFSSVVISEAENQESPRDVLRDSNPQQRTMQQLAITEKVNNKACNNTRGVLQMDL